MKIQVKCPQLWASWLKSPSEGNCGMLDATRSPRRHHTPVLLPNSCLRHRTPKLPKLQWSLHYTATPTKAMQSLIKCTQGKHTCLVLQSCHQASFLA